MNDTMLAFGNNLSIGYLDIKTMELKRLNNISENHPIFTRNPPPYDYYFVRNILIIPDPVKIRTINLFNQEIETGEFIACFNYEEIKENCLFVTSLTLPQFTFLNHEVQGGKNDIFY